MARRAFWPFSGRAADAPGDSSPEVVFDEVFLGRLRRLTVLPGQVRAEGIGGEHRSRRRGVSPEFADFKAYSHGDDFRRIDWNTYARLDGLFIRLSEVTSELGIHLLVDASESMQWQGDPARPSKFTQARRVAGTLGYIALWHFDRLTVTPFGDRLGHGFGPAQGRTQALPMLKALESMPPLGGTALPETIGRYLHAHRRPGVLIIVSDLLSGEPEDLRPALRDAKARGWEVTVVQVLDEAELLPGAAAVFLAGDDPRATTLVELVDSENGEIVRLTPDDALLDRYSERVTAWLSEIEAVCADERAGYLRLLTGWDIEETAINLLREHGVVA
jgi:uncharacterized protein (DUF58 family)